MPTATAQAEIELGSIHWERVQLIVEGRVVGDPGADAVADPGRIGLIHAGDGQRAPATHVDAADDGRITVRFDVMTGPGRQPLAAGRWRLEARICDAPHGRTWPPLPAGVFPLVREVYRVSPILDGASSSLSIDVTIDDADAPARPWFGTHRLRRALFSLVATIARHRRRPGRRRVLFASRLISEMSGNLQVVHDRMVERGLDRDLEIVTMLKPGITARWPFRDRFRLAGLLVSSDVVLVDDVFPPLDWARPGPEVRVIQLWHASGAFKTIGYSRAGKPGGPNPFGTIHRNYTAAIVSSDHDVPFYAEAFGIPEANVIPTGIPRMDRYFDEDRRDAALAAAQASFPAIAGRQVILFAPTYRGETYRDAYYDFGRIDYAALHALCLERDAVVIIKMHPFVQERPAIPEPYRDRIFDGAGAPIDVNDLLFAVDLLITDYSSIVFEYSVFDRPMLFFAYDLDEYIATRDFYVPFRAFVPGRIVSTFGELLAAIRSEDYQAEKVGEFARRHFAHLDGGSTDRVIDELILAP